MPGKNLVIHMKKGSILQVQILHPFILDSLLQGPPNV